jgi:hypothetical protein
MRYPKDKRRRLKIGLMIYAIASFFAICAAYAFDPAQGDQGDAHKEIVKQALYDVLAPGNLAFVEKVVAFQSQQDDPRRHFAQGNLDKSKAYIERESKVAINYASDADANVKSRERALMHLGLAMHTAQDFYCRTNYLELQLDALSKKGAGLDPYTCDLIDWTNLQAYQGLAASPEFDKCAPNSPEGAKKYGTMSYYQIARALAIRETQRQWETFDALVRRRYAAHATTITTAFKQASCPDVDLQSLSLDLPQ